MAQARRAWVEPADRPQHPLPGRPARLGRRKGRAGSGTERRGQAYHRARWVPAGIATSSRARIVLAVDGVIGLSRLSRRAAHLAGRGAPARRGLAAGRAVLSMARCARAGAPWRRRIIPAIVAVGALGSRSASSPLGLALVPALVGAGLLLDVALRLETRVFDRAAGGMTQVDRTSLLATALAAAFLAFLGGGEHGHRWHRRAGPGRPSSVRPSRETGIVAIALADALVAGLLGYRFAVERLAGMSDAIWSAVRTPHRSRSRPASSARSPRRGSSSRRC